ncbi:MAG: M36 family metallopeptidase [Cytophagaceae bacterium]|nr:M36 family metallopeptidase [Cytophagaceae bacterium]
MRIIITLKAKLLYCCFLSLLTFTTFAQNEEELVKNYFKKNASQEKLSDQDLQEMQVSSRYFSSTTGWYHIYFNQTYQEIEVYNGLLNVTLKGENVIHVGNSFVENLPSRITSDSKVRLKPVEALQKAAIFKELAVSDLEEIATVGTTMLSSGIINKTIFTDKKLSNEKIEVKLFWLHNEHGEGKNKPSVNLVWNVRFSTLDYQNSWNIHVDASTGEILGSNDEVIHCDFGYPHKHAFAEKQHRTLNVADNPLALVDSSYNVFDIPLESPNHGARSVVEKPYTRFVPATTGPGGTNGWHNDGATDYTTTRGNNVWAQEDNNGNNGTGASPISATLEFDFSYTQDISTSVANRNAAITNLFYWNNLTHDVLYRYGFNEPSGNFQNNNMGRGGNGNDYVFADAQDGSGSNNANFLTPIDGTSGRMQMFLWNDAGGYQPDGDFDNAIIAHEYGHGWSTRLTGGPGNSSCLQNAEQGGEGWSDYLALMLTTNWSALTPSLASANLSRGIGTYALGQATNDLGIRLYPYSYDMANVNSQVTYGKVGDVAFSIPHGVGSIWATMLWDMTWEIILQDNQLVPDIYNTTNLVGNVAAMKLVNEGLRLQPCSPSFIQARDAIIAADQALFNGLYKCAISRAFARRGLGMNASTGISNNDREVVEDFTPIASPSLSSPINTSICSNTLFTYTASSATGGVSFAWVRPVVAGISNAAGSGNTASISETLINTTNIPVTVKYYFSLSPSSICNNFQPVSVIVAPQSISTSGYAATCSSGTLSPGQGLVATIKTKVINGSIQAGPTYVRGSGNNTTNYTSSGTSVYFKSYSFVAPVTGSTVFEVFLANLSSFSSDDTYLSLYQTTFNPAAPSVNFLRGDDDNGFGSQSRLVHTLTQGQTYIIVVSTYDSNTTGTFTLKSSKDGIISDNNKWFTSLLGGTEIGTGAVFNPVGAVGSGISNISNPLSVTFYVADEHLLSCRTPAVFSVQSTTIPPTIVAGGPLEFCPGASVSLSTNISQNNALDFSGVNSQYVTVPHSASLNLTTSATFEAWVKYSGTNSTIIDKGDYDFLWSLNANGNANKMGFYNKTSSIWVYSNDPVPQNTWTHVAITLSGGIITFYINGLPSGSASMTIMQDTGEMNIGRQQPSLCQCNHFNGTLDELRLWNIARTQEEILVNKNNSVANNTLGLVAYYKFDEGTGITTADATPNNNHGTLVNGPNWVVPSSSPINSVFWSILNVTSPQILATAPGDYTASFTNGLGCIVNSIPVQVRNLSNASSVTLLNPTDNFASVNVTKTASSTNGKITATNIISGNSRVNYSAKAIELNAGFKAENGTIFLAQTGGCSP